MLPLPRPAYRRFLVLAFAILALTDGAATASETQKRVLVVNSTRRDVPISIVAERELPRILGADLDGQMDYYSEYLDVPRFSDPSYRSAFCDFLKLKYQDQPFDLVVAMGDEAFELLRTHRADLFPGAPVVFFVSRPVSPFPNSTGVVVALKFDATLKMVAELQPETRNVYVVTGASSRDKFFEGMLRVQLNAYASRFNIVYLSGLNTQELDARLARLPAQSVVYYVLVYQDGSGGNFQPMNYLDRVAAVASAPTYSWVDTAMDRGVVGGSLLSVQAQTEAIAALAFRVLSGEPASAIPTVSPDLNVKQVDWRQLRRWGIREARVPQGTIVRFKESDGWNRYRVYIIGGLIALLAQSALIAGLLVQGRMRRRAEIQVRENEAALRSSNERIHDLGGRLLLAQEAERARIARELHDDVNQQVALLAIDLELLRDSGRKRSDAPILIAEACERAHGIAKSLHDLSHQLHPARLRMLGLVPALSGLQRELSRPDCVIEFSSNNVPAALPQEITLCLFRVAQEALHNALTHSGAGNVSVHVAGEPDRLTMTIVDDGAGFDVSDAWHRGLGLVSMGERLESIDGTFEIRSRPGSGTRVSVTVPFRAQAIAEIVPA
jgi:signal transduction histidine kinase